MKLFFRKFVFIGLNFNANYLDASRKHRVVAFHKRFRVKIIKKYIDNFYFGISKQECEFTKEKYKEYL